MDRAGVAGNGHRDDPPPQAARGVRRVARHRDGVAARPLDPRSRASSRPRADSRDNGPFPWKLTERALSDVLPRSDVLRRTGFAPPVVADASGDASATWAQKVQATVRVFPTQDP